MCSGLPQWQLSVHKLTILFLSLEKRGYLTLRLFELAQRFRHLPLTHRRAIR
jgi:hypothetical protein